MTRMTGGARKLYDALFCYGEEPRGGMSIPWFAMQVGARPATVRRWMGELTASATATVTETEPGWMSGHRRIVLPSPTLSPLPGR